MKGYIFMSLIYNTTNFEIFQSKRNILFYTHLSEIDRKNIERLYNYEHLSIRSIAKIVGRSPSTISREIKKGTICIGYNTNGKINKYRYDCGQKVANDNKVKSKQKPTLSLQDELIKFVIMNVLQEKTSFYSSLIRYTRSNPLGKRVSLQTLYNYYHKGYLGLNRSKMPYPFVKKHVYSNKQGKRCQKGDNISLRDPIINLRLTAGDWEGDLIVGSRGGDKKCILNITERKTRYSISFVIPNKTTSSVVSSIDMLEQTIGSELFKKVFSTITFDNGCEFQDFKGIARSCTNNMEPRTKVYYANPYRSCERGSNENCNRMYRRHLPKKVDFSGLEQIKLNKIQNIINNTPRKILDGDSARERIDKEFNGLVEMIEKIINH